MESSSRYLSLTVSTVLVYLHHALNACLCCLCMILIPFASIQCTCACNHNSIANRFITMTVCMCSQATSSSASCQWSTRQCGEGVCRRSNRHSNPCLVTALLFHGSGSTQLSRPQRCCSVFRSIARFLSLCSDLSVMLIKNCVCIF
jgi:hypothetical protein